MEWLFTFVAFYLLIPIIRGPILLLKSNGSESKIKRWYQDRPHHIWVPMMESIFGEGNSVEPIFWSWIIAVICLMSIFVFFFTGFDALNQGFQVDLIPAAATGLALYFNLEVAAYINRHFSQSIHNWLKSNFQFISNWILPKEIKEATKYRKEILKLVKDKDQKEKLQPILSDINDLIEKELPRLLKRHKQLQLFLANAIDVVEKEDANGIAKGESELMDRSKANVEKFDKAIVEVEEDIKSILAFIHHSSVHISDIIDAYNDLKIEHAKSLMQEAQLKIELLLSSQEELAELKNGKLKADTKAKVAARQEVEEATTKLRQAAKIKT